MKMTFRIGDYKKNSILLFVCKNKKRLSYKGKPFFYQIEKGERLWDTNI